MTARESVQSSELRVQRKDTTNYELRTTNSLGFTLVELLVVITIIAILSAIGLVIYSGVQASARDVKRKADLMVISRALEQFKAVNGVYPLPNVAQSDNIDWGQLDSSLSQYITQLPVDPKNGGTDADTYIYAYGRLSAGSYRLCANLENNSDKARNVDYPAVTTNPPANSCSGVIYGNSRWADYKVESQL